MPQFASKRRVRHSASQMFDLVADVERYPDFVPLCKALKIRQRTAKSDGTEVIIADMTVSFKLMREAFTSRVTLDRNNLGAGAFKCLAAPGMRANQCSRAQATELDAVFDRNDLLVEQVVGEDLAGNLTDRNGEISARTIDPRCIRCPDHTNDERHFRRKIAHYRRRENGLAVVVQSQDYRTGLAHPGLFERRLFEHVADDIDAFGGHAINHHAGLARVLQHLDNLASDRAEAGQHDGAGAPDRHGHATYLFQIVRRPDDHQNRAGFDARFRSFGRREHAAQPLPDDGYAVCFAQAQVAEPFVGQRAAGANAQLGQSHHGA